MKMCRCLLLFFSVAVPALVGAEEETFISLTRSPISIEKLPTNVEVITSKQIELSGATQLSDVMDMATSVNTGKSGSLGSSSFLRIRGVPSSNQVQVLVDDQPLGGSSIQNINVNLLSLNNIDRIEIIRGGASVIYGANSVGGVVRILTKKNTKPWLADYSIETGSFDSTIQRAEFGGQHGGLGLVVRGSKTNSDGYQHNADVTDEMVGGTFSLNMSNGGRFELAMDNTDRDLGNPSGTPVAMSDWDGDKEKQPNTADSRIQDKMTLGRAVLSLPFGAIKFDTSFYGSRERYEIQTDPGADPFSTFDNRIAGNDTRVTFTNGALLGLAYERDSRRSLGQNPNHIVNTGAYAQVPVTADRIEFIPAVRYDHHSAFGGELNPRVAAVGRLNDVWRVTGNIARSQRNPTLSDLYDDFLDPFFPAYDFYGNADLRPEKSWSYDVGTELRLTHFRMGITGFVNEITDRILSVDTNSDGIVDTLDNIAQAEIKGFETTIDAKTGFLDHRFNHTFQESRGTSPTSSEFVPLRMTPRHTFNYQLDIEPLQKFHVVNQVRYVTAQYQLDNNAGIKLPCYTVWDAQVRQTVGVLTWFVRVDNITNRRYAESVTFGNGVPQPTRSYWGGVKLSF